MTDLIVRPRLLPARNARARLDALVAVDGRLDDIDTAGIVDVLDPWKCPAPLLRWLAWERSVDVWDPDWTEDVKRAVIDAAPAVHARKGTRRSIEIALAALQVDAVFTEWFETVPMGPAYTFAVKTYARARLYDGPLLDDRLIEIVYSLIMSNKPVSRAFRLSVGAKFPRPLGVAAVATAKNTVRVAAKPTFSISANRPLGVAGVALAKVTARRAVRPSFTVPAVRPLGVACAATARVVVRRSVLLRPPA